MGINLPCGNKPLTTTECGGDCDEKIERLAERVSEAEDKLDTIQEGAEVNVNADWEETDPNSDAYIENKPSVNYDLSLGDSAPTVGSAVVGSAVLGSLVDIILGRGDGTEDRVSVSGTGAIQITRDGDTMTIHVPVGEIDQLRNGTDTEARAWAANVLKQWLDERIAQIPADQFLDLNKTVFANPFTWSSTTYPGSINPNLDGKPVLVLALTDGENVSYSFLNMEDLIDAYEGVAPISVNGSQISHDNSGVTAGSYGDSSNQTPNFGDTFKALRSTVDAKGHVTSMSEHTVKIPDTLATQESAGLMSAEDKEKLDNVDQLYKTTCGNPIVIDDADGEVKSLNVELTPIQAGTPRQDSTVYNEPYLSKDSPSFNSEYDELVGGTVAWNQLIPNPTSPLTDTSMIVFNSGTRIVKGHKYIVTFNGKKTDESGNSVNAFWYVNENGASDPYYIPIGATRIIAPTRTAISNGSYNGNNNTWVYIGGISNATINSFNVIDLTQMFGSTIADYIYSLETATAGAGVAFFRKLFPKPYYAYNAGELISVKTSSHNTVGFNQWDEEWELGSISSNTGEPYNSSSAIRSKNFCRCIPNTVYHAKTDGSYVAVYQYDADKNYVGYIGANDNNFTTLANAAYFKLAFVSAYGTTYKNDICINLSWDGERDGEYEPYVKHEYALDSDLELRGIPKLDASGNLYYDGDEYPSDGSVARKYGIVDLGTLDYTDNGSTGTAQQFALTTLLKANGRTNFMVSKYFVVSTTSLDVGTVQGRDANQAIVFNWTVGTNAPQFKAAMNGVYLVYELATPTTETVTGFTSPQAVGSTESYTDNRDVPIPVGHESRYADIFPISPHTSVSVVDTNGTDTQTVTVPLNDLYGGSVDVIGGESETGWANIPSYNGETISEPWLSSMDEYVQGATPTTGAQVTYKLATPTPLTTTPTPLTLYKGDNVISSEGDMCITYLQDRGDLTDFINEMKACCEEVKGSLLENLVDGTAQGSLRGIDTTQEDANYTIGKDATALGNGTKASGDYSVAEGTQTEASGFHSHAEGVQTKAMQQAAHAEGASTTANALFAHAEGSGTSATGLYAHSEGGGTTASGESAHAEGGGTTASAQRAHAEGGGTTASGLDSHAEGSGTTASGDKDHAEGYRTTASGGDSHAEGAYTVASGLDSHSEGNETIANHLAQHVFGEYNIADASTAPSDQRGNYVEIVGNGAYNARSNARTLDWNGNEALQGALTLGKGTADEVTITAAQLQQLLTLI